MRTVGLAASLMLVAAMLAPADVLYTFYDPSEKAATGFDPYTLEFTVPYLLTTKTTIPGSDIESIGFGVPYPRSFPIESVIINPGLDGTAPSYGLRSVLSFNMIFDSNPWWDTTGPLIDPQIFDQFGTYTRPGGVTLTISNTASAVPEPRSLAYPGLLILLFALVRTRRLLRTPASTVAD